MRRAKLVGAALGGIAFATVAATMYLWLFAPLTVDQSIAATASSLTAGAFVIAVLAGIIAVSAYRDAQRKPRLALRMDVRRNPGNCYLEFHLHNSGNGSGIYVMAWVTFPPDLAITNTGDWTPEGSNRWHWEARAGQLSHPIHEYDLVLPTITALAYDPVIAASYTIVADGVPPFKGEVSG